MRNSDAFAGINACGDGQRQRFTFLFYAGTAASFTRLIDFNPRSPTFGTRLLYAEKARAAENLPRAAARLAS